MSDFRRGGQPSQFCVYEEGAIDSTCASASCGFCSAVGGAFEGHHPSPLTISGGGDNGHLSAAASTGMESCGVPIYRCQLPSDVIWAPTAWQPSQHPPPYAIF